MRRKTFNHIRFTQLVVLLLVVVARSVLADPLTQLNRLVPDFAKQSTPPDFRTGPQVVLSLAANAAADPESVMVDEVLNADRCTIFESIEATGAKFIYTCTLENNHDTTAVLTMQQIDSGAVDLSLRVDTYPLGKRVIRMGIRLSMNHIANDAMVLPIFQGHIVEEPALVIPANKPIRPGPGMSMQWYGYESSNGGFIAQWTDPEGEIVHTTEHSSGNDSGQKYYSGTSLQLIEHDWSRRSLEFDFPLRIRSVAGDWYDQAKAYRAWILANAQTGILKAGTLENSNKVKLNMLIIEANQPPSAERLARIARLKSIYGENLKLWYFLWNITDQQAGYGHFGSYFPKPGLEPTIRSLRDQGILITPYTYPGASSIDNPFVAAHLNDHLPLTDQLITQQDGTPVSQLEAGQFPVVKMDITDEWISYNKSLEKAFVDPDGPDGPQLGSGYSGRYMDLPGYNPRDHDRKAGRPLGVSREYYVKYREFAEELQKTASDQGYPETIQAAEAAFERLIPVLDVMLGGGGASPKIYAESDRTYPAPLFQLVYNEYINVLFSDPLWGPMSYIAGYLGPPSATNRTMSISSVEGIVHGRLLTSTQPYVMSDLNLLIEEVPIDIAPDAPTYYHYGQVLQHGYVFHEKYRDYFKNSEMLRDPKISGNSIPVTVDTLNERREVQGTSTFYFDTVANAAFKHKTRGLGIFLGNGTGSSASITIDINKADPTVNAEALKDEESGNIYSLTNGRATITVPDLSFAALFPYDECPKDRSKYLAGSCGCQVAETDSDSDGTPDCLDNCKDDNNKTQPGSCGCGSLDVDSDSDGTPDCIDSCPNDANKTEAGVCGCGVADVDSDLDTIYDCNDSCIEDSRKSKPGLCGCGVAETDSDGDGTPNCNDNCPQDANKISAGSCGCGNPDTDKNQNGIADCRIEDDVKAETKNIIDSLKSKTSNPVRKSEIRKNLKSLVQLVKGSPEVYPRGKRAIQLSKKLKKILKKQGQKIAAKRVRVLLNKILKMLAKRNSSSKNL